MLRKLILTLSLLAVPVSFSPLTASRAEASYGQQFGQQTDYSYTCDFARSLRVFKFNGNGKDTFGKYSRCYNNARHSMQGGSDKRYRYDQFGYDIFGIDQKGRDIQGVCRDTRCATYHYRDFSYYRGRSGDPYDYRRY